MPRRSTPPVTPPVPPSAPRKGARRRSEVPREILDGLNRGDLESANLVEGLVIRFDLLLQNVVPEAPAELLEQVSENTVGITRRMALVADWLAQNIPFAQRHRLTRHSSDTVRGWGAYYLALSGLSIPDLLAEIHSLADDPHFGVREWAWMAIRPRIAEQLPLALRQLRPWTKSTSANVRRFAVELTRPCGVWCAHLNELKSDPEPALPLLEATRADETKYVQDSVSNWLSDAAKSQPDWVTAVLDRWEEESPCTATERIIGRVRKRFRKPPKL